MHISYISLLYGFEESYAQTCDPCSGIIVNRTFSSSSLTQAIFPRVARDAVNSINYVRRGS